MDSPSETDTDHRTRLRQQEAVAELGQRALETDDIDGLLHDAAVLVAEPLEVEYAGVLELLPGGTEAVLERGTGWRDGLVGSATVPAGPDSHVGYALRSEEPVIVDELSAEERFSGPEILTSHDVVSGIAVAIGPVENPWGVLGTYATERREFTERDANFVRAVANVLASAIENRRTTQDLELFRTLLDHSTDSVLVIDPETGEYLDVNEAACRRRGYSREELLDLTVPDLETELPTLGAWHSFVDELKAEGEITFHGYHRRKDRTAYPVEVNASYVELDREYVLAIARDVTERRERERELEQYRALTQAANDVIVTIDERSTIQSVNQAVTDVFGYDRETLVGESLTVLMPDELADGHREAIRRYLETGERTLDWNYLELPGRRADGSELLLGVSFGEVRFGDERFFTGILRDITERKEIERRLEESNERLEQFAYAVSHDLQEPLRMVTSYLQLLERRYGDELDADAQEFIEFAVDGAERMREMIDGLLAYSRVETESDPLETVDLDGVLEDVLADLRVQMEETDAEIAVESLPRVEGDASQLRQVFQNLLDNAMSYSGDDPPEIHVSARRDGAEWIVSVSDEGVGISPDAQDRVFEVFQRLHSQEDHAGTGIGLALTRRIVERHGGEIWVDSAPGDGATFSFTLPAAGDGEA